MKNWVQHFVAERLDWMSAHSYRNCHAVGVDSIMFDDTRGREIRLFIAHENHTLDAYFWGGNVSDKDAMAVAFHPHHCDLQLHVVCNCIDNINVSVREHTVENGTAYKQYAYKSKIRDGESRFQLLDPHVQLDTFSDTTRLYQGETIALPAKQLHTIRVDKNCVAAWFVYEGEEDPEYQNIVYSNANLTQWTGEGLYLPMTKDDVLSALRKVELL